MLQYSKTWRNAAGTLALATNCSRGGLVSVVQPFGDILSGRHDAASFANIVAIAESLGLGLRFDTKFDARKLKREQAERKARKLVALVQGTSGLEGQAVVDEKIVASMIEQTTHELLAGPKRKLWSDE